MKEAIGRVNGANRNPEEWRICEQDRLDQLEACIAKQRSARLKADA
jgi:hypothetical protein